MLGPKQEAQGALFYEFSIEQHVPQVHLLRSMGRFVDLSSVRRRLAASYSSTGRPSIDPELMIRMLIVGYCFGIRSERRLCQEVHLNLAYRWFCRLGLEDRVPDHSTFSLNRHGRFREAQAFRFVFEQVLKNCIDEGLVGGEGFAVDASVVKADASRQHHHEDDDDWRGGSPAIAEYLEALDTEDPPAVTSAKRISHSDPSARWTAAPGGTVMYIATEKDGEWRLRFRRPIGAIPTNSE